MIRVNEEANDKFREELRVRRANVFRDRVQEVPGWELHLGVGLSNVILEAVSDDLTHSVNVFVSDKG